MRWGGGSMVLGRVRLQDGLVVLMKYLPVCYWLLIFGARVLPYCSEDAAARSKSWRYDAAI